MVTTATVDGEHLVLDLGPRDPLAVQVRQEAGARRVRGAWRLPHTLLAVHVLRELGISAPEPVTAPTRAIGPDTLYAYQREAAGRLAAAQRGALLLMSPGLGKTAVTIAAADAIVPNDQVVVVAPASLLETWQREIDRWSQWADAGAGVPDVYVVRGAKLDEGRATMSRWIIVSWDAITRHADWFARPAVRWPLLVLDESILTKNRRTRRYKALRPLRRDFDRVWLLSGSPTSRHVDDLWAQLSLIWPAAFASYWRFARRYAVIEDTVWGPKVVGTRADRDVLVDCADLVHVVSQEDVLDLPELIHETVDVTLTPTQRREEARMASTFTAQLASGEEVTAEAVVAQIMRLQQIASWWDGHSAKHDALVDLLPQYEGPHLVWTHWREGGQVLAERLAASGRSVAHVVGGMPAARRDEAIEGFKRDVYDVLVVSLGVGKFGHTITNARTVWYVDKTWSADDYFQSLHRVRRIGLAHRPVVVTLRAPGTADDLVEDNLAGKLGSISSLTRADLTKLMEGIGR